MSQRRAQASTSSRLWPENSCSSAECSITTQPLWPKSHDRMQQTAAAEVQEMCEPHCLDSPRDDGNP